MYVCTFTEYVNQFVPCRVTYLQICGFAFLTEAII